jgi:hypothetical protein
MALAVSPVMLDVLRIRGATAQCQEQVGVELEPDGISPAI